MSKDQKSYVETNQLKIKYFEVGLNSFETGYTEDDYLNVTETINVD